MLYMYSDKWHYKMTLCRKKALYFLTLRLHRFLFIFYIGSKLPSVGLSVLHLSHVTIYNYDIPASF